MNNKICRIYKLVSKTSDYCFIGSTLNKLHLKFNSIKNDYKNGINLKPRLREFIERYGVKNINMILIKEYEIVDHKHKKAYEQLWMNNHKKNFNNVDAFVIKLHVTPEIKKEKKDKQEKTKKDKSLLARERYLKLKAKTIECTCGKQTNVHALRNHVRTKFHQEFSKKLLNCP
jgi:hypothetical protein